MKAYFVTGTDTGVGKTTVACALLAAARARGLRALAMKPIETGCRPGRDGVLLPLDAIALELAARGIEPPVTERAGSHLAEDALAGSARPSADRIDDAARAGPSLIDDAARAVEPFTAGARDRSSATVAARADPDGDSPASRPPRADRDGLPRYNVYRFAAPLAPSVAAELEGAAISLAPLLRAADRLRSLAPDVLLVEGAGGLLVPLTDSLDMADLAAALRLPLIVVARDGLGTINHSLLTLEAAVRRCLQVAAVILSVAAPGTSDRDAARNAAEIERRGRVPVLGRLPHLGAPSFAELARAVEAHLDLSKLLPAPAH